MKSPPLQLCTTPGPRLSAGIWTVVLRSTGPHTSIYFHLTILAHGDPFCTEISDIIYIVLSMITIAKE